MTNKYCDCGDPFPIHDADDANCSKVRGVAPKWVVGSSPSSDDEQSELREFARKVANLAITLKTVMQIIGVLAVIGGVVIAFQSTTIDLGNGYGATSRPYLSLGVVIAMAGLLQTFIIQLVFSYIEMQARYRMWKLKE